MGAVILRFRAEVRRLRRSLALAAVVGGVAGAISLTALTGALRTDGALDDYLDRIAYPDVSMDVFDLDPAKLDQVENLDTVQNLGGVIYTAQQPRGYDLVAGLDVGGAIAMTADTWTAVDVWVDLDGRIPTALGEVLIDAAFAERFDLMLGDELVIDSMATDQLGEIFGDAAVPEPRGRSHRAVIVGIARDPLSGDGEAGYHALFLPEAFAAEYSLSPPVELGGTAEADVMAFRPELRATLVGGAADADRFVSEVTALYDGAVDTSASTSRSHLVDAERPGFDVQATALALFGLVAALVGLVAFGNVVARIQAISAAEGEILASVGLRRWQRRSVLWLLGALAVSGAVAVAVTGAVVASPWSVQGRTARISTGGVVVEPRVLVPGAIALAAIYLARAVLSGAVGVHGRRSPGRLGVLARVGRRLGSSGPALIGSRFALHRASGPATVPVGPVLVGAAAGIAGIVAAIVLGASLDRLLDTPRLWGRPWDAEVVYQATGEDPAFIEEVSEPLVADDRTQAVTYTILRSAVVDGSRFNLFEFRSLKGSVDFGVLSGRLPEADHEIAFDGEDLAILGRRVGDTVDVRAGTSDFEFTIVGRLAGRSPALVPSGRDLSDFFDGDVGFFVTLADNVDANAYRTELAETAPEVYGPFEGETRVARFTLIRDFPTAFAIFLAIIALSAVGHGLVVTVRRHRADFGALRAIGYTRRSVRSVVGWQASIVLVVGIAVGLPLGIAVASITWSVMARSVDAIARTVVPAGTIATAGVLAVVGTLAVAAPPVRRVGQVDPSEALRGE